MTPLIDHHDILKNLLNISSLIDSSFLILDDEFETYYMIQLIGVTSVQFSIDFYSKDEIPMHFRQQKESFDYKLKEQIDRINSFHQKKFSNALDQSYFAQFIESNGFEESYKAFYKDQLIFSEILKNLISKKLESSERDRLAHLTSSVAVAFFCMFISFLMLSYFKKTYLFLQKLIQSQGETIEKGQRLITAGEVFGSITHDIKTPLAIMQFSLDKIVRTLNSNPEINKELLNQNLLKISKMITQIDQIVKNMRSLLLDSKEQNLARISISDLITDIVDLTSMRIKKSQVVLNIQNNIEGFEFLSNKTSLIQIVANLVNNSCDALLNQENRQIIIKVYTENNNLFFIVSDNGPGIPKHIQDKIFESLYTTKEKSGGTGLGLSVSRKLAENLDGSLRYIQSEGGACFELKIPLILKSK